jgi:hypothetical protein
MMKLAFLMLLILAGSIFTQDNVTSNSSSQPTSSEDPNWCNTTLSQCYRAAIGAPLVATAVILGGNANAVSVNNSLASLWAALSSDVDYWALGNCTDSRTSSLDDPTTNYTASPDEKYFYCMLLAFDFEAQIEEKYIPNNYICNDGGTVSVTDGEGGVKVPSCKCSSNFQGLFCFFSNANYNAANATMKSITDWKIATYGAIGAAGAKAVTTSNEFSSVISLTGNIAMLFSLGNNGDTAIKEALLQVLDLFINNKVDVYTEKNILEISEFFDFLASLPDGNSIDLDYSACSPQTDAPVTSKSTGQAVSTPDPNADGVISAPQAKGAQKRVLQAKSTTSKNAPVPSPFAPSATCPKSLNSAMTGCKYKLLYQVDPKALNAPGKTQVTTQVCSLTAYSASNPKTPCTYPTTVTDSATLTCPWAFVGMVNLQAGSTYSDKCKPYIYKNGTWVVAPNAQLDTSSDKDKCVLKIKEFGQYGCACTDTISKAQVKKAASTSSFLGITITAIFLAILNLF